MKRLLKKALKLYPPLYWLARKARSLLSLRVRIVRLSRKSIDKARLEEVENSAAYNDVINDLVAYTGFSREMLLPYLLRCPERHFESEFNWYRPVDELELTWFYRCNAAYLFANAIHRYAARLNVIRQGRVLDFGAGIGCNTLGLAKKGIDVDFLEINRTQADFINFRAERHGLKNIREVLPYYGKKFDPVRCIKGKYDAIIAIDVLEHIPNYHIVVRHFIERLEPGGMIVESSPFDPLADDIAIHVRADVPLEEAMVGMERIGKGIWKKRQLCECGG